MSWFTKRMQSRSISGCELPAGVSGAARDQGKSSLQSDSDSSALECAGEAEDASWKRSADGPIWPPLVVNAGGGRFAGGVGLDRLYLDADVLILTGWASGGATLGLSDGNAFIPPVLRVEVERPDVASVYTFEQPVRGFLCLWRAPFADGLAIVADVASGKKKSVPLKSFPRAAMETDIARILREYASAKGVLFDALRDRPGLLRTVAWSAVGTAAPGMPRGHMDSLKTVPGAGAVCVGWSLGNADFFVVDDGGVCVPLSGAMRWNRPDIFEAFSRDYGADCADAGFLQALPPLKNEGAVVRLLARTSDDLILLNERAAELAPLDAVGYARWAFGLPVPAERMVERFAAHDGALLRQLVARSRHDGRAAPVVRRIGTAPKEPEVTLIVPLFGRYDFMDHQLLEFSDDAFIREHCEVLYVVDDPNITQQVFGSLVRLWQQYRVPLTVVWGGRNRGFSGANNLGLSVARGRKVLFLNSDVIPRGPGWLEALSQRLDDSPEYGLLGVRLLFAGGGLQHDGMSFEFDDTYGVYLNLHPGRGIAADPAREGTVVPVPAATGACLIASREEILGLGGFSEDYLIGDFEDSDLCFKVETAGRRIGVCPDIVLTHLERQSFGLHGSGDFRIRVTLFNAWLHQERWGDALARHEEREQVGADL